MNEIYLYVGRYAINHTFDLNHVYDIQSMYSDDDK